MLTSVLRCSAVILLAATAWTAVTANEPSSAAKSGTPKEPQRILWETDVYNSYLRACEQSKSLVIFFDRADAPGAERRSFAAAFGDHRVTRLADRAIFVRVVGDQDDANGNVARLKKEVGVDRYPFLAVLEASPGQLVNKEKIVGSLSPEEFARKLEAALGQPVPAAPK
jgi:hypothetical protein